MVKAYESILGRQPLQKETLSAISKGDNHDDSNMTEMVTGHRGGERVSANIETGNSTDPHEALHRTMVTAGNRTSSGTLTIGDLTNIWSARGEDE